MRTNLELEKRKSLSFGMTLESLHAREAKASAEASSLQQELQELEREERQL